MTTAPKKNADLRSDCDFDVFHVEKRHHEQLRKITKDYYVSIGREDKATEFYTKKDLEDEKVQLIAAVERHEKQLQANQEEITTLKQMVEELKKKHGNLGDGGNRKRNDNPFAPERSRKALVVVRK